MVILLLLTHLVQNNMDNKNTCTNDVFTLN